jgi:hypothetical protein
LTPWPQIRNLVLASGIFLLILGFIINRRYHLIILKSEFFSAIFITFFFIYGLLRGNNTIYILYDFSILATPIVVFYLSRSFFLYNKRNFVCSRDIDLAIVLIIISFFWNVIDVFAMLILSIGIYQLNHKIVLKKTVYFLILILFIILKFSSAKTLLLLVPFLSFFYLFAEKKYSKLVLITALIFIGLFIFSLLSVDFYYSTEILRKPYVMIRDLDFELLYNAIFNLDTFLLWSAIDISTGQRLFELITVINDSYSVFIGNGLGASFDLSATKDLSIVVRRSSGVVDSVRVFHLALSWLIAKTGLLGLGLFVYLYILIYKDVVRYQTTYFRRFAQLSFLTYFILFNITFGRYFFLYFFPLLFGYLWSLAYDEI